MAAGAFDTRSGNFLWTPFHPSPDVARPRYRLRRLARRLQQPVHVTAAPGDRQRLYVVQRTGRVRVLVDGKLTARIFLDLRGQVSLSGEEGLFSIAFHPNYASNGLVYAAYNRRPDDAVTVVEYESDGTRVDRSSARVLVSVPHEDSAYHNGGQLAFGPDGLLYAGIGDGGYELRGSRFFPDPHGNSQKLDVLLGKIFRLDVTSPAPRAEIVAYGLRNPWRFSFDVPTGRLVIGDVGWNEREEVDVVPAGSGLVNLGWSVYEGRLRRSTEVRLNRNGILVVALAQLRPRERKLLGRGRVRIPRPRDSAAEGALPLRRLLLGPRVERATERSEGIRREAAPVPHPRAYLLRPGRRR